MKIAIDLDDVLINFLPHLIEYHNFEYKTNLTLEQFHCYRFWEIWGGTKEQAVQKVYDFYKTEYFQNLTLVQDSQEAVNILNKNHDLVIITARQNEIKDETVKLVDKYFPNIFNEIYFANFYGRTGISQTKKEICDLVQADVLIEDSIDNSLQCLNSHRKIFLFNRPWNQLSSLPKGIQRANSWKEILKLLN